MDNKVLKRKMLIYAHYYYPDVASTSQMLTELAEGMAGIFEITVICVVPSYTGKILPEYKTKRFYHEKINDINVVQIKVPEFSKESKVSRIKNILAYFFFAIVATFKVGKQDYIFTLSQPPILGGLLGVIGKWIKHAKLIYNIQDYNPEQTIAVRYSENKAVLSLMMWLDKFSCRRTDKVIVVGRDMLETLVKRFSGKKVPKACCINSWVDETEIYPLDDKHPKIIKFKEEHGLSDKYVIMYSGNIGLYYDLEKIFEIVKEFKNEPNVVFAFVGQGSIKEKLISYKEKNQLDNVIFIPYQAKKDLIYSLNAADIHWVINAKGIKGVSMPSKLYGVMAAGKPAIGVLEEGTEGRILIKESGCGILAEPGKYEEIKALIRQSIDEKDSIRAMGPKGRDYYMKYLVKDVSIEKYINEIWNI
ncbi:glycosyl transferase group 1 [Syntrophobotulus glycolicus DSM 8271]|uniref:Glycosyl transferase group 1 n=1 Tax=Syntrophobotulus glycolicus (strain DSM 8271 / FlGlyR) TaxID=645991 RepID=F0SXR6_SYNGF|nr:glycosyltransferase family 4 protein [Syntrophobotulus glycolicus]ADY55899.1 glycosyl transferase group 1 [Syntrophobotulus glycolicus DSM 8271]